MTNSLTTETAEQTYEGNPSLPPTIRKELHDYVERGGRNGSEKIALSKETQAAVGKWADAIRCEPTSKETALKAGDDQRVIRKRIMEKKPLFDEFFAKAKELIDECPSRIEDGMPTEINQNAMTVRSKLNNMYAAGINLQLMLDGGEIPTHVAEYMREGLEKDLRAITKPLGALALLPVLSGSISHGGYNIQNIREKATALNNAHMKLMPEFDELDYSQVKPGEEPPHNLGKDLRNFAHQGSFIQREDYRKAGGNLTQVNF